MISSLIQLMRRLKRTVHVSLREQEEMPVLDMHASMPAVATGGAYQHLDSFEDITQMQPPFRTLKVDWCGSTSAVTACVAELEGPRYVVFVKPREVDTDIFRAVEQRAIDAAKGPVQIYTINPVILLTLVRERMQAEDVMQRSSRIRGQKEKSAVRQGFYDIVSWAVRNDASDLHLNIDTTAAKSRISATIDGQYTTPEHLAMPTQQLLDMASVAWLDVSGGNGLFLDMANEQQGRLYEVVDERSYMLRWGSFIADKGPSITLRLLDVDSKVQKVDMAALGYLPSQIAQFERAMRSMGGAIVMGGIPGSGKTVSIAQLIVRLPKTRKRMSIEDPVELIMEAVLQASVSRSLDGSDRDTMKSKLMALKRAAASDVFLGEIRDVLTGAAFQDIVLSGSNLYCTTHVGGALAIPQRFASSEIGIPRSTLGTPGVLKLLVHQALMPKLCSCALPAAALLDGAEDRMGVKRDRSIWQQYLADIETLYDFGSNALWIRNPLGCEHCRKKGIPELFGYAGRTAVAELFEPSSDPDALRAITSGDEIRLREIFASQRTARYDDPDMQGKSTMDCAVYKMSQGLIDPRDIEPHFTAYATLLRQRKKG
ncbi:ATPase, T2SS/T4P/T4SS family [Achromobacter sp. SLBN-14]|uniref:ATPase, T2SS/T4P/T4SS family n=1 Tax=Achromobacter sp. SLBN-14 TaxID=2768442 RepID=UPI001154C1C6|nr:ATPase, T2SS/T4P/T4SS family [Achromobacter sp. SLBN-14]TQJ94634.1 type II secretory ATPase GspE/PulE/Tfp pilus assembly ATPase PilB-like protein [Achromobacter sp. SLBN-14]